MDPNLEAIPNKIANSKKKLVDKIYRYSHVWSNKNVHTNSKRGAPCFARGFFRSL